MTIKPSFVFDDGKLRALIAKILLPNEVPVFEGNTQFNSTNIPFYIVVTKGIATTNGTSRGYDGKAEIESFTTNANIPFSITIIGKGAMIWAERLQPSFRLTSVKNELNKMGVGVLQISGARNQSFSFDSGYEERAQFDIILNVATTVKDNLNVVNSVELGLHIEQ